ncbi:hypothetical protein L873DRAFT_1811408 [Choiromyces venosus 120613-1]|uniref:Uncharacterized protein n=1 Tax=Choiromyces venosus 120613-1 TaxID=1336337 RepID=A0A3N4JG98_9PEZI|nr:hypothetical protein L873DRAFT_1811408 [Choiromyces venosus 120613-1]
MSDPISTPPFVVTKALSKVYYKSLPSQPPLIATTKPCPFEAPTGPEAYSVPKELRCLADHHLTTVWGHGLAIQLCRSLTTMGVKWSCLDALHIANVGEPSGPAIIWIGVEFRALSFEEGSKVAINCHTLIDSHGIRDYYVEIRESHVMRQAGNRFFDPVPFSDPTFTAQDPYTATLGIPISIKDRPRAEGTGGFYLSAGGNDKNIYLVTARHVVLPVDNDGNKEYYRQNESKPRDEVVVLGTGAFNSKLAAIDYEIRGQEYAITVAKAGIESVQGMDDPKSVREYEEAEKYLEAAEKGLEALKALRHEIATHWMAKEKRYICDLAIIKINAGKLDANNYRGNTINIGKKYSPQEFMDKVYLHPTSPTSFKFPYSRLVKLEDQVPESTLVKLPMLDANGDPYLVVFKNGATTGTTIGRANNVSSYTRNYFAGQYYESREWPVIPTDKYSGAFSAKGDSGSCVADAYSRVGGILTGGSGATDSSDITYVTPISFIMKVLHDTRLFKHAHLSPALA